MLPGSCVIASPKCMIVVLHCAMLSRYQLAPLPPVMSHDQYIDGATLLPVPARIVSSSPLSRVEL